jgi:hypothetical protein
MHLFNVRVKSEDNTWGPLFKKAVQITDEINNPRLLTVKAAEYFWDTDPGYGSANTLLAFDGNFNEALESIVTANATLPATGLHLFNVRVKSENNKWGPLFKKAVQITDVINNPRLLSVTAAECFWDTTDPGYGNGMALLAFDGNFNEAIEAASKTLSSFSEGLHLFNIRARDEKNKWSPLFKKVIQADAQPRQFIITQGEYFWDADPGYGNGYQYLAIDGNFNEALENAIDYNGTSTYNGLHLFNTRVKDEKGRWGPLFKKAVMIIADFTELDVTINYDTATICTSDSVYLLASGAGSYVWSPATGLSNTIGAGVFAKPTATTTYMVIGQGDPGEYDTAYVTVKVVSSSITLNLGNDTSVCSPATVTLNAGAANTYAWSTGATSQTISVNSTGNYSVTITNAAGCTKADTIHVTVDTITNAGILPLTVTICNGQSANLSATGGNTYLWSNSLGTGPNVTVSPTTTTIYTVTITKGVCVTTASRTVTVNQPNTGTINASICQGQSFFFNGVNRTTNGAYLDTLVGANGCDSILTLNLTVKPTTTGSINASICQGQSYFFNGVNRTTNGAYLDTLVGANGCDSILTLNLTVKPTTTGSINASICQGQSYFFNGVNRTTNGAYLDTLVGSNGCDSILTLNLTVKPTTTGSINASICQGQSYFFNGVNRTTNGAYVDTLVGSNGCDSILTLNLTVKPTTSGSINASICQGQSYFFNGVNRTTNGAYVDTLVGSNGCDSILTLNLTVKPTTSGSINASICQGQSYFFNGVNRTTNGAYSDTLVGSNGCDSILTLNLTVKPTTSGSINASICQGQSYFFNGVNRTTNGAYVDTLVGSNGCDSILTLNLTVKQNTNGTLNVGICQGQSYLFNGISRTVTGIYLDTLVNVAGCDSFVTLNLIVSAAVTSSFTANICQGQSYLWNGVNRTTSGAYLDTLTANGGCDSIVTLNLVVNQPTSGNFSVSICSGQSYFFNGINRTTTGAYLDTLVNSKGCDSILTLNLTVKPTTSGSINASICAGQSYFFNGVNRTNTGAYLDTLVGSNGCDSILTLNLTVKPTTSGSINASICQGQSYFFNGVNRTTAGVYLDTLIGSNGCDSVLTLNLTVKPTTIGSINASICAGQSYFFNGVNRTTAGAYLDTLVGSNGCDSVLTLNLTVKPTTSGSIIASICAGQSYFFNGVNRTTAGVYLDTLVGSNGCDSILTLNLTVKLTTSGSINASICQGQSYFFNGVNRTTTGAYLDTLVGSNGCDSILTLNLTVKPTTSGSISASICQGQSYLFNGVNRTSTGAYLDTLVGSNGCDSILTLNLTVNQNTNGTLNVGICQGQSYLFNGISRTVTGIYLDTLANVAGCDSLLTLNLTVSSAVTSSFSAGICQGQSYLWNGINRTTTGSYLDTLTANGGCDSIVTLILIVNQPTSGSINASICAGQSYFFNGANRTTTGAYLDTLVGSNGCDSILTLNLTVKPITTGSINATICQGQSYLFNGVNRTTAGAYLDTLLASNGCDSILTLNLTVNQNTLGTLNVGICQGQSYFFNGLNLTTTGAYLDTLVNAAGCDSLLTLNLTVNAPIATSLNQTICSGSGYPFNGQQLTQAGIYYDTLQATNGCDSLLTLTLSVNPPLTSSLNDTICEGDTYLFNGIYLTQEGQYFDTVQTAGGCDSILALNLKVHDLPQPAISKILDTLFTQTYASYQWLRNNAAISGADSSSLVLTQTGNYSVIVTDVNGCSDTSAVINVLTVTLDDLPAAYGVKLYPNPNTGFFILEFSDDVDREIEITDAVGRLIYADKVHHQKQFTIDKVAAGVYFLNIQYRDDSKTLKFNVIK